MQIIKPGKLSLISKTYGFQGHQFAVGALCFFKLGVDNQLLTENSQWPRITPYLNNGILLDLGYAKAQGEVLVAGKAIAPDQKQVRKMKVSVSLGRVKKRLNVIGDRCWNGSFFSPVSRTKTFSEMPITYQQAYGGVGYKLNPLGKGRINRKNLNPDSGYYDLPNIYIERESTFANGFKRTVAGFGPLDISWPQRSGFQGTYNKQWLDDVHPGFPDDTNRKLFNAAPSDQQIKGFFRPGDRYRIQGMNGDLPKLEGRLPSVKARVFISQQAGNKELFKELKTVIDTVWFFPELALGVAIHRGVITVNDSDGLDVKKLLLALDGVDGKPRKAEYFSHVMALRLDPKTALSHVFNESQLMPVKTNQQQLEQDQLYAETKRLHKEKIDKVKQLHIARLQADNPDLEIDLDLLKGEQDEDPGPIPQELLDIGDFDLSPYLENANKVADKAMAEMEQRLSEIQQEKNQYAAETNIETETINSMQARVNRVIHVQAADLAEKNPPPLPVWMAELSLTPEQSDQAKLVSVVERQSRQMTPDVTVLSTPLAPEGASQLRIWVQELMAESVSLAGRDLAGADLSGMDFSALDMRDVMLERADLSDCNFDDCLLDGAVFSGATLHLTRFTGCSMQHSNLAQTNCKETCFVAADLSHANLSKAIFSNCDFSDARLDEVLALAVDMRFSTLHRVQCEKGQFVDAQLDHSDWQQACLLSCIFLQPSMQQVNWQQAKVTKCLVIDAMAQGSNFCGIRAEKVQFSNRGNFREINISAGLWETCGFRGLDLSGCDGSNSVFKGCDFGESKFVDAKLSGALFDSCTLSLATFLRADLRKTFFNEASLRKCLFDKSDLGGCEINNTDMTELVIKACKTKGLTKNPTPSIN